MVTARAVGRYLVVVVTTLSGEAGVTAARLGGGEAAALYPVHR